MAEPPILTLADLRLSFGGDPLFEGAALSIQPGERIALVGRNGSGKSTLMKLMAGLAEADAGTRFLRPGASVGYMAQDPDFAGFASLGDFAGQGLPEGEDWRVAAAMAGLKLDAGLAPARRLGRRAAAGGAGEDPRRGAGPDAARRADQPSRHRRRSPGSRRISPGRAPPSSWSATTGRSCGT